jgi:hypothetical protein
MMRRKISILIALFLVVPTALPAQANVYPGTCGIPEQQKFMEAFNSSGQLAASSYAAKSQIYTYNRTMDSCASVANTTFMMFNGARDYVEAGARQYGQNSNFWLPFCEYRVWPASVHYTERTDLWDTDDQWIWLRVYTPSSNTVWRCAYSYDGSSYTIIDTTVGLLSDHGTPESEISRYPNAGGAFHAKSLQRFTSTGSWANWTDARCSTTFPNSINDWNGHVVTEHEWETIHNPVVGDC